ncbi:MAG: O-antigen ligase family protein [Pseudomonadota bacterium]
MIAQSLIPLVLVAIAQALSLEYTGGLNQPGFVLGSGCLLAAACIKVLPAVNGDVFAWSRVHTLLAAYIALLVLLVYTSTLAENSMHYAWLFASLPLVFLVFADASHERWLFVYVLFSLTGLVSACWGIAEFLETGQRANGPIIDPSTWGAVSNLFFFSSVAVFLTTTRYRVFAVTGLIVFAVATFAAYSRVGNFIFFVALAFVVLVCAPVPALRSRLGALVGIAVLAFVLVNSVADMSEAASHDEGYTFNTEEFGWNQRFAMWDSALDIYREFPVLGSGPGTFKVHYPRYRSPIELRNTGNFVHNDYLQFLVEGGPLLLLCLLGFVAVLLAVVLGGAYRCLKRDTSRLEPMLLAVACGTPLIHGLMNFPLYQLQIQLLLGLLFARLVMTMGWVQARRLAVRSGGLNRGALVALGALLFAPALLDALSQDLVLNEDRFWLLHHLGDEPETYVETISLLSNIRSRNSLNRLAMATIYRTSFDAAASGSGKESLGIASALEYQAGLAQNPWHAQARGFLADLLEENPWLMQIEAISTTPEQLLREGIRLAPVSVGGYLALANLLERQGRKDESYELLVNRALPWANLRQNGYENLRHELFLRIMRGARERGDRDALGALLKEIY